MIEVKDVCYKYKSGDSVINNVSLSVKEGETIAIIRQEWFSESQLLQGLLLE